jgi:hypothetical protein
MKQSLDWSLQQTSNLKGKLDAAQSFIVAVNTAFAISGGDDAKAGKLIRELMERQKSDHR